MSHQPVPLHFPFRSATTTHIRAMCSCGKFGPKYKNTPYGDQLAMGWCLDHSGRNDHHKVSQFAASPVYGFEVHKA